MCRRRPQARFIECALDNLWARCIKACRCKCTSGPRCWVVKTLRPPIFPKIEGAKLPSNATHRGEHGLRRPACCALAFALALLAAWAGPVEASLSTTSLGFLKLSPWNRSSTNLRTTKKHMITAAPQIVKVMVVLLYKTCRLIALECVRCVHMPMLQQGAIWQTRMLGPTWAQRSWER